MWHTHTTQDDSVTEKNEVLINATTWVNREATPLSESSMKQKAAYCVTPFTRNVQKRRIQRRTADQGLPRAGGRDGEGLLTGTVS